MEQVFEFLYQGFGVLLFCVAAALLFNQFGSLGRLEEEAKRKLYDKPVLYCRQIYE